jgi:DNA ligase-1
MEFGMTKFRSPMLASDYDESKLKFPLLASPKIDGIRCVLDRASDENLTDPYTRSGKIIRNKYVQQQIGLTHLFGLDGELVVGEPNAADVYNKTSSGIMSTDGEPDFTFWVFDYRELNKRFLNRHDEASRIIKPMQHPRVKLLEQIWVRDVAELEAYEAEQLEKGFEGIMIRDPESLYKFGRSTAKGGELLKVKRVSHDEAVIVGFVEQMHNANEAETNELGRTKRSSAKDGLVPADTLGAFICRNGEKWTPDFNISPGVLNASERKFIWDNRNDYMGLIVNFKHLAHGAKDRPRHGRFNGFRHVDDLS